MDPSLEKPPVPGGPAEPGRKSAPEPEVWGPVAFLHHVEDAILALLLGAMILLAPLQIFLRNFFDAGISWGDPLLRVMVLWVGLMGALAASRSDRHITIDVLSRVFPERARAAVGVLTAGFTTGVCWVVAWNAARFVISEREFESVAFASVPAWWLASVIPLTFGLIGLRYALRAIGGVVGVVRTRSAAT